MKRGLNRTLTTTQRPGSRLQREFSVLILCVNSPSIRTLSDAPSFTATRTPPDWRHTDTCAHKENESALMTTGNNGLDAEEFALRGGGCFSWFFWAKWTRANLGSWSTLKWVFCTDGHYHMNFCRNNWAVLLGLKWMCRTQVWQFLNDSAHKS